jgi:hypothetical protein
LFSKAVHFALVEGTTDVWTLSDRSQDIIQEVDQKLKGPLSLRSSSSRRPLQVDLSKLEVSSPVLVLSIIISFLLKIAAPLHQFI